MPLENNPQYPTDLDPASPLGTEDISEGDNHLRNIKQVISTTFANVDGPITVTDTEINHLSGTTSNIQTQITNLNTAANRVSAGTTVDNLLRWNGTNWVETAGLRIRADGSVVAPGKNTTGTTQNLVIDSNGTIISAAFPSDSAASLPGTAYGEILYWNSSTNQWEPTDAILGDAQGNITIGKSLNVGLLANLGSLQVQNLATGAETYLAADSTGNIIAKSQITAKDSRIDDGTGTGQTLYWTGTKWDNTGGLTTNASGNTYTYSLKLGNVTNAYIGTDSSGNIVAKADPSTVPIDAPTTTNNTLRANGSRWSSTNVLKVTTTAVGVNLGTASPTSGSALHVIGTSTMDGYIYAQRMFLSDWAGTGKRTVAFNASGQIVADDGRSAMAAKISASGAVTSSTPNISSSGAPGTTGGTTINFTNNNNTSPIVTVTCESSSTAGTDMFAAQYQVVSNTQIKVWTRKAGSNPALQSVGFSIMIVTP